MKKIIIIGAGIAGLTAGCYGRLHGFDTEIYEMHTIPGGLCTSWKRKDYTIDGCIHWLMGVHPESLFYGVWNDLGILEGKEFIRHEYIMRIENSAGKKLVLYSDIDRLEAHLLELSLQDADVIRELTGAVRRFKDIRTASKDPVLYPYCKMTVGAFMQRIADPFLREAFLAFAPKENSLFSLIFQLAIYNNQDACWPVGGSLAFARGIEKRYCELGGSLFYQSKAEEIIVENNRATGIRLTDGSVHPADYVISAADGYETVFHLLKGRYMDAEIQALYDSRKVSKSSIQISLGIACDLSRFPYCSNILLDRPVQIGGQKISHILIKHFCYDKTLCPPDKSVVTSFLSADYTHWEALYRNPEAYKAAKNEMKDWFIRFMESRYPDIKNKIEVADVATPVTYTHYTGVWQGAYSGWNSPLQKIPNVLPELDGLYLAGQWTQPTGGIPTAAITGKGSIMRIVKAEQGR